MVQYIRQTFNEIPMGEEFVIVENGEVTHYFKVKTKEGKEAFIYADKPNPHFMFCREDTEVYF